MEFLKEINDKKIIVGLILLQLAVTLPFITSYPIDLDEPFSIFYAQQDLSEFIPFLEKGNNPPMHFVLLHFWIKLFGISSFSVRSLSLLFSVLSIPITYKFGKKIVGQNYAILLVGFFIFSSYIHFHSIEARGYSMLLFFVLLAINDLFNLLFIKENIFYRLAVWNALLLYAHYLGAFIFIGQIIIFFIFYRQLTLTKIKNFIFSIIITIVLYLPKIIQFINRISDFKDNGTWVQAPHWSELYGNIFKFFNFTPSFLILIILLFISVFLKRKRLIKEEIIKNLMAPKQFFVFVVFGMYYFGMYVISLIMQPVFLDRYLLFVTPFLFLSFIILIKFVLGKKPPIYYLLVFLIPMIVSCYYIPNTNRDGDKIGGYVKAKEQGANTVIALCPPFYDLTFIYHFDQSIFKDYSHFEFRKQKSHIQSIYSYADLNVTEETQKIIFVDANSQFLFPGNDIVSKLSQNYTFISKMNFKGDYCVYEYKINDKVD